MKIKTNLRAGAKSGTVASGNSNSTDSSSSKSSTTTVVVTRCAGL